MSEKKNMTGKENSFHMENFRRRSRYAAVFLVLILALGIFLPMWDLGKVAIKR